MEIKCHQLHELLILVEMIHIRYLAVWGTYCELNKCSLGISLSYYQQLQTHRSTNDLKKKKIEAVISSGGKKKTMMSLILEISDAMEEDIHLEVHLIRCYSLVRYYQSDPRESMMVEKISMTVMESQKHGAITFKRKEKR